MGPSSVRPPKRKWPAGSIKLGGPRLTFIDVGGETLLCTDQDVKDPAAEHKVVRKFATALGITELHDGCFDRFLPMMPLAIQDMQVSVYAMSSSSSSALPSGTSTPAEPPSSSSAPTSELAVPAEIPATDSAETQGGLISDSPINPEHDEAVAMALAMDAASLASNAALAVPMPNLEPFEPTLRMMVELGPFAT